MNSHKSGRQPSESSPGDDSLSAVGLVPWAMLVLAALLVGVFVWDTWTDRRTDGQTAADIAATELDREDLPNDESSRRISEGGTVETIPSDVQQIADSQPSAADHQTPGGESAGRPTPDCPQSSSSPTDPKPVRPEGGAAHHLAALDPFEAEGVERRGNGHSISISGTQYEHAICVEPSLRDRVSQISFSLEGKWARLRGVVGITGGEGDVGSTESDQPTATFRIYGDANLLWGSKPLSGGGALEPFEVNVAQLDILALVVESRLTSSDKQPVWGNLQLVTSAEDHSPADGDTNEP